MKDRRRIVETRSKQGLSFEDFRYEPEVGLLYRAGVEVPLAPRAQQVLHYLLERAGRPVSKDELLDAIWKDAHVAEASLSEAVARVRDALGDDPQKPAFIQTLHRRGYRFIARVVPAPATTPAPGAGAPEPKRKVIVVATLLLAGILVGWSLARLNDTAKTEPPVRFTVEPPPGERISQKGQPALAMSPDGRRLVATLVRGETTRLWLRELHRPDGKVLEGTEGAVAPFFSPYGDRIGFFARGKVLTLSLSESAPVEIAEAPEPFGGTWISDDRIAFSSGGRIHIVSSRGGPDSVKAPFSSDHYRWPEAVPGRDELLVTVWQGGLERANIALLDLETGAARSVAAGAYPKMLSPRQLAHAQPGRILWRRLGGRSKALLEGVTTDPFTGAAQFAVGASALAYLPGSASVVGPTRLQWIDQRGLSQSLPLDAAAIKNARLSPDGESIALTIVEDGGTDLYLWTPRPRGLTRLTADGRSLGVVFSPDGERLALAKNLEGRYQLFVIHVNGVGEPKPEPLVTGDFDVFPTSWSRDGKLLALDLHRAETGWDVFLVSLDGERALRPIAESPFHERAPRLSPDGDWISYQSDETGTNEIYVRRVEAPQTKFRVSSGGGEWPLAAPTGKELYYLRGRLFMRVTFEDEDEPTQPEVLFDVGDGFVYDVSSDGRFLAATPAFGWRPAHPHIVLGWTELEALN